MSDKTTEMHPDEFAFHVGLVSRLANARLSGEATIEDLVRLMLDMGWSPPTEARAAEIWSKTAFGDGDQLDA